LVVGKAPLWSYTPCATRADVCVSTFFFFFFFFFFFGRQQRPKIVFRNVCYLETFFLEILHDHYLELSEHSHHVLIGLTWSFGCRKGTVMVVYTFCNTCPCLYFNFFFFSFWVAEKCTYLSGNPAYIKFDSQQIHNIHTKT